MIKPKKSKWTNDSWEFGEFYNPGDLILYEQDYYGVILRRCNLDYTYDVILWVCRDQWDNSWKHRKMLDTGSLWKGITMTDYNTKLLVCGNAR